MRYLSTGHSMDRGSAFGPMAEAVHLSFAKMTPSDIKAIAEYVRSVPAVDSPDLPAPKAEPAPTDPSKGVAMDENAKGREFFAGACAGCHGWSGANSLVTHATLVGTRAINDPRRRTWRWPSCAARDRCRLPTILLSCRRSAPPIRMPISPLFQTTSPRDLARRARASLQRMCGSCATRSSANSRAGDPAGMDRPNGM